MQWDAGGWVYARVSMALGARGVCAGMCSTGGTDFHYAKVLGPIVHHRAVTIL
jgi:hypothetical protein